MNPNKRLRLRVETTDDNALVGLDRIEIWDGADLALLREVLSDLISEDGYRSIGVDLTSVKYIPSGFFGMLFEWYESGIEIQLHSPQPNVENMLWFRMYFEPQPDGHFLLTDEAVRNHTPGQQVEYHKREFRPETDRNGSTHESLPYDIPSFTAAENTNGANSPQGRSSV